MTRVGDILTVLFDEEFAKKAGNYSNLFSCWKDLTEKNGIPAAADHSWIKSLDRGLVWIEVDHPGWKQILQTKESKLLHDFRYRFPDMDISALSISLCRPGARPASGEAGSETIMPEEDPPAAPAEPPMPPSAAYDSIKNGSLKEVLMKLEKSIAEKENQRGC